LSSQRILYTAHPNKLHQRSSLSAIARGEKFTRGARLGSRRCRSDGCGRSRRCGRGGWHNRRYGWGWNLRRNRRCRSRWARNIGLCGTVAESGARLVFIYGLHCAARPTAYTAAAQQGEGDAGHHEQESDGAGSAGEEVSRPGRAEELRAAATAKSRGNVGAFARLHQDDDDEQQGKDDMDGENEGLHA